MNNISQILITSSVTVITGVVIYTIGRIVENFLIEPIKKQKEVIGEIADMLVFNSNLYTNPYNSKNLDSKDKWDKGMVETRKLSSLFYSRTYQIPCYFFLSKLKIVIGKEKINNVCSELIGLSNSYFDNSYIDREKSLAILNSGRADRIKELLNIPKT